MNEDDVRTSTAVQAYMYLVVLHQCHVHTNRERVPKSFFLIINCFFSSSEIYLVDEVFQRREL